MMIRAYFNFCVLSIQANKQGETKYDDEMNENLD
jgi:hypothetical protein